MNFITGFMHLQQDYLYDFSEGRQGRSFAGQTVAGLDTAPLLQRPLIVLDAAGVLSPNGAFVLAQQSQGDQFSQEIKFTGEAADGKLKYVSGLYYFREDYTTDRRRAHQLQRRCGDPRGPGAACVHHARSRPTARSRTARSPGRPTCRATGSSPTG